MKLTEKEINGIFEEMLELYNYKGYAHASAIKTVLTKHFGTPPEPEIVPFTKEDYPEILGESIRHKISGQIYILVPNNYSDRVLNVSFSDAAIIGLMDVSGGLTISPSVLLKDYTFLDGSPCGKMKK